MEGLKEQAKNGDPKAQNEEKIVEEAEKNGAAWAFRWVAVLPCILVVVFGLIALTDRLRGGYRAVHITEGRPSGNGALGHAPAPARTDAIKGRGGIQT